MLYLTECVLFAMTNVYCVNDNLLHSELQTSSASTVVKNAIYKQRSRRPENMNFKDIFWSVNKMVRGKNMYDIKGNLEPNTLFHEVKGYYQGVDNSNRPVYFEVYMKSVASNSQNQEKLYQSNQKRLENLENKNGMQRAQIHQHVESVPHGNPPIAAPPPKPKSEAELAFERSARLRVMGV